MACGGCIEPEYRWAEAQLQVDNIKRGLVGYLNHDHRAFSYRGWLGQLWMQPMIIRFSMGRSSVASGLKRGLVLHDHSAYFCR